MLRVCFHNAVYSKIYKVGGFVQLQNTSKIDYLKNNKLKKTERLKKLNLFAYVIIIVISQNS